MSSYKQNAVECFGENMRLFGNPQTQTEKYNLYNGLAAMTLLIEEIRQEQHRLSSQINQLCQSIGHPSTHTNPNAQLSAGQAL